MVNVVISYDYELCWGVWDKVSQRYVRSNVAQANAAANALVVLHRKHSIPSTWGIVGALLSDKEPTAQMIETARSETNAEAFSAFVEQIEDKSMFRADKAVIAALRDDPLFEPASHTYSHIYALESDELTLEDDFTRFDAIFQDQFGEGRTPTSLIFPKNQSTDAAIAIAQRFGFTKIRVNPLNWLYEQRHRKRLEANAIRVLRFLDSFLPILEIFPDRRGNVDRNLCVGQYFFRPCFSLKFLDYLHYARLRLGLWYCCQRGKTCHIWTHPHNFGANLERSIANAERLFVLLNALKAKNRVKICHMKEQD